MRVIALSLLVGVAGIVSTRAATRRLARRDSPPDPHTPWALGLAAVVPAWTIAFVALLGSEPGARPQLISAAAWVLSVMAALGGAIATVRRVRTPDGSDGAAGANWKLGVLALLPAWVIVLIGHAIR